MRKNNIDTGKVTRVEIIDLTKPVGKGGGRVFTMWDEDIKVDVDLQDKDRTLKIFISR